MSFPDNRIKYFLANYEEHLREAVKEKISIRKMLAKRDAKAPNNFFHREHIWATKDDLIFDDSEDKDVNKRRLGNFILLKETQNIKVSNKPVQEKIDLYWADRNNDPNTLMIRHLKKYFEEAIEYVESEFGRTNRTWKYWNAVFQAFFDRYEQCLVNFALQRWRVVGLHKPIKRIALDSFSDKNEIYRHKNMET